MYVATLDARTADLVRLTMTSLRIRNFRLTHPEAADRAWLRNTLDRECRRYGRRITRYDDAFAIA